MLLQIANSIECCWLLLLLWYFELRIVIENYLQVLVDLLDITIVVIVRLLMSSIHTVVFHRLLLLPLRSSSFFNSIILRIFRHTLVIARCISP